MILFYEPVGTTNFMTLYPDSDKKTTFYFAPLSARLAKRPDGTLHFGARLFPNNGEGFAIYNFAVTADIPTAELEKAQADLQRQFGPDVRLTPIVPTSKSPSLEPLSDFDYKSVKCSSSGVDLFSYLACSFRVDEFVHPHLQKFFTSSGDAWHGQISWKTRTQRTAFKWEIRANWRSILDHFKAQVGIKYWDLGGNLSTEIQKLIQRETMQVKILGGSPAEKEKIRTFAEHLAGRMFKQTLEPKPQPGNPEGSILRLSLDYNHAEEDKTSVISGEEGDFEERDLGLAALIGRVPSQYFSQFSMAEYEERVAADPTWPYTYLSDEELAANRNRLDA